MMRNTLGDLTFRRSMTNSYMMKEYMLQRAFGTVSLLDRGSLLVRLYHPSAVVNANVVDQVAGNLPTEKVTKRDLFHIFHKHGKLAQISLKQAYGFVQFLEANACYNALSKEQGASIRGRKIRKSLSRSNMVLGYIL